MRGDVSGFSPRQHPENLPQHPQHLPEANGDKAEGVAGLPDKSASRAKRAGDFVAQRKFIRNGPATPEALPVLKCCGVAGKSAISRGLPGTGKLDFTHGGVAVQIQDIQTGITLTLHGFSRPRSGDGCVWYLDTSPDASGMIK